MTILHDSYDTANAADPDDLADRRAQAREAEVDRHTCTICGGYDPDGTGECPDCFTEEARRW